MNLLLDTHVLLSAAERDHLAHQEADRLVRDPANTLWFSVVSLWEVAVQRARGWPDFRTDPGVLRAGLLANAYRELPLDGRHVLALANLPPLHADPFDRMLIAQATVEGMRLVTLDPQVRAYGGVVLAV